MNSSRNLASLAALANQRNGIAEIAVVAESVVPGIYQDWPDANTNVAGKAQPFGLYRIYCANGVSNAGQTCLARHIGNGINIVFADGHAKFVPGGRMQGGSGNSRGEYPIINPNARNYYE
jgi:prepilin-type processing-associated H-X9-DG protein